MRVTLCTGDVPPKPLHTIEYVDVVPENVTVLEPDKASAPLHAPEAVQDVAFAEDHFNTEVLPGLGSEVWEAVIETVAGEGATFVVAHTDVDVADMKALATAVTVKQYLVFGMRLVTAYDFVVLPSEASDVEAGDVSKRLKEAIPESLSLHESNTENGDEDATAERFGFAGVRVFTAAVVVAYGP